MNTEQNTTNGAVVAAVGNEKYGLLLDGSRFKLKPGRRPGVTGKKAAGRTVYVFENQVLGRGKPSDAQLAGRMVVCLAPGENYDPATHQGTRDPQDDVKLEDRKQDRAYKAELAAELKASAKLARDAERAARKAGKVNATAPVVSPASPVTENVSVPVQAINQNISAPANTTAENETVAV